jgi:hypothetical protein
VRVVFLSTVIGIPAQYDALAREALPAGVETWHIVDEMLARLSVSQGYISPFMFRRVAEHARAAEEAGAVALQITCSSVSPCVPAVRQLVGIPVFSADEELVEQGVTRAGHIGIAATAATALDALSALVRARAAELGKPVQVEARLAEGAYAHLLAGDLPAYDRAIQATLADLAGQVELVLLAQASMTRAAAGLTLPADAAAILAGPPLALRRLRRALDARLQTISHGDSITA